MAFLQHFDRSSTHRLIPTKYGESVLEKLPLPKNVLADLSELDAATNERILAENGQNPTVGRELIFGVSYFKIVNSAFSHPGPWGGRFHGSQRGAWYAGFELETSLHEVAFHKRRFLEDARINEPFTYDYVDYLADFSGEFHYLDKEEKQKCLQAEPIPVCYAESQALALKLLHEGSNGIVYPSVRYPSGTCIACFRPALVFNPRKGADYKITVQAGQQSFVLS